MRDERAVHTGVIAQLAAAVMASLTAWHFTRSRKASVGSTHGWHKRTDGRFVGDADDSYIQGNGRQGRF